MDELGVGVTSAAKVVQSQNFQVSLFQSLRTGPLKVAIIGSGNWGTVVAGICAENCANSHMFAPEVSMYVHEELYRGEKLTTIINRDHTNPVYLPGITIPKNVVAYSDVRAAAKNAHLLIFVLPHQFVHTVCADLNGHVLKGAKGLSLVKGLDYTNNRLNLITEFISDQLKISCSVMSGANIASEVARKEFAETTIGYADLQSAVIFQMLFDTPYFRVNCVPDVAGVEISGALKNVVALASGFVDGLKLGSNTKSAIMRIGLNEMRLFASMFYSGVQSDTFYESCGVADLVTSCVGGRNLKCAEEFVRTRQSWPELEKRILGGQKLQGTGTARDAYGFLKAQGKTHKFPLFTTVYQIVDLGADPKRIVEVFQTSTPRPILQSGAAFASTLAAGGAASSSPSQIRSKL